MQCEKLKIYGKQAKKNSDIGKWLFIVAIAVLAIGLSLLAFGVKSLYVLVSALAIFCILIESSKVFLDKADEYKECIRERIILILFKHMQHTCKNGAIYSIYWACRDTLVILGTTDTEEQIRISEMFNNVISNAIKQTGLKIQFEIDLKAKENTDGISKT